MYTAAAARLSYTLEIQDTDASNAAVGPTVASTAASAAGTGFRVFGSVGANQAGTCAASDTVSASVNTCAVVTAGRTITVTY
ncbi:MAG TPA: hypothetical protein VFL86_14410 [Burkholderiaceae bacterium]|nr:hypothetical protein [Burkholderiaceae bacterium]